MPPSPSDSVLKELRSFGLSYPGAHTKAPWPDHMDLAVDNKTFAYLSVEGEPLSISCKLPWSSAAALLLPFAEPTAYGLGESGWVTARFSEEETPPLDTLKAWVDESYRAQAPKRLVSRIPASLKPTGTAKAKAAGKRTGTKPSELSDEQAAGKSASQARASRSSASQARASRSSASQARASRSGASQRLTAASPRKAAAKTARAKKNGKSAKAGTKQVKAVKATKPVKAVKARKAGAKAPRKRQ